MTPKPGFNERSRTIRTVQKVAGSITSQTSLLGVMNWLGCSFAALGDDLARYTPSRWNKLRTHYKPFSKGAIHNWTRVKSHRNYRPFPRELLPSLERVINDELVGRCEVARLQVSARMNSPLKITVSIQCACGKWIKMDWRRRDVLKCNECAK